MELNWKTACTLLASLFLFASCSDKENKVATTPDQPAVCGELRPIGFSNHRNSQANTWGHFQVDRYVDHQGRQYSRSGNVFTALDNHQEQVTCHQVLSSTEGINHGCEHVRFDRSQNIYYHRDTRETLATYSYQRQVYIVTNTTQQFHCSFEQTVNYHGGHGYNQNFCQVGQPGCYYYGSPMHYVSNPFQFNGIWFSAGFYFQADLNFYNINYR